MISAEALAHALTLFRGQRWKDLCDFAGKHLDGSPEDAEIWKLYGVALVSLGYGREARRAFLCALNLNPKDGASALNYIASCLQTGDIEAAGEAVQTYFQDMTIDLQARVAESYQDAVASHLLDESRLPAPVRQLLDGQPLERKHLQPEEASRVLLRAAAAGATADAERAWEDGANIDIKDREGWGALHVAIRGGHLAMAEWLLQFGADPLQKGPGGQTPRDLARQASDPRFGRLMEGYFPKVKPLESSPFTTYNELINEIYWALTDLPARAHRYPQPTGFEELGIKGVSFGLSRAELSVDLLPALYQIFSLQDWEERPEEANRLLADNANRVLLLTMEWVELSNTPLHETSDEEESQLLSVYSRNIEAIARLYIVPPRRLERLMGSLFYEDQEEPQAIGILPVVRIQELFGENFEFVGWDRLKWVLAEISSGLSVPPPERE